MRYASILTEVSDRYPVGRTKLTFLEKRSREFNGFIERAKVTEPRRLTYSQILQLASERQRSLLADLEPDMLHYNGTRVAPCARTFFRWYETTDEGQRYKADIMASCPSLYGNFSYIHF